jgi:serine/threonine protein kinase
VTRMERVVAGRYRLLGMIGQGAAGTVWRASDLVLDREVAVKEIALPASLSGEERRVLRERSLREAKVAARLNHPGVVTVHDVLEAEGNAWIVMELVIARSLSQVLATEQPLTPAAAAQAGSMLLAPLAAAHAAGIVHRDIKPANVLLAPGRVVLTDFGMAMLEGDPQLTQAGMVVGTPGYCAPERIRGQPASAASDIWSVGATLYASVTGRGPFESQGSPMAVLASIVHDDPPPIPWAGALEQLIGLLMRKEPAERPGAAAAARLLSGIQAPQRAAPHRAPRPVTGRHRRVLLSPRM